MKDRTSYLVFTLLCLIWGSSWLAIKIGLEDAPPIKAAAYRLVIGSALILALTGRKFSRLKLASADWLLLSILGVFNFGIAYYLIYWAEQYISSGLTAILFSSYPLFVAVFSKFYLPDEPLVWKRVTGMVAGVAGIAVIYSEQLSFSLGKPLLAMLAVTASAVMIALVTVKAKQYLEHGDPVAVTMVQMFPAVLLLVLMAHFLEADRPFIITAASVGTVVYLAAVVTTVAFLSFYWLLKREPAIKLTGIALIAPVIAVFLGWIFLGESITLKQAGGAVLVIGGVRFVSR